MERTWTLQSDRETDISDHPSCLLVSYELAETPLAVGNKFTPNLSGLPQQRFPSGSNSMLLHSFCELALGSRLTEQPLDILFSWQAKKRWQNYMTFGASLMSWDGMHNPVSETCWKGRFSRYLNNNAILVNWLY